MTPFIRWAFWAVGIYFILEQQYLYAGLMFALGVFPFITIIGLIAVACLAGCTTYNTYDSFNTTEIRVNDMRVQRQAVNPNNPYKRELK